MAVSASLSSLFLMHLVWNAALKHSLSGRQLLYRGTSHCQTSFTSAHAEQSCSQSYSQRTGKVQVHWVFIISHGFTISLYKHAKDYWIWMIEVLLSFIILTHWGHCWCYLPYNSCTMDGARRIMQHSRRKKIIQVLGSPTHRVKQLQDRSTEAKDEP